MVGICSLCRLFKVCALTTDVSAVVHLFAQVLEPQGLLEDLSTSPMERD